MDEHRQPRFYFIKGILKQIRILNGKITSVLVDTSIKLTPCPMPANKTKQKKTDSSLQLKNNTQGGDNINIVKQYTGHFRVPFSLFFKASLSATFFVSISI